MKLFYLRENFCTDGVRDKKLKETLDSASRLAMGGGKKNRNKHNINGHCGQKKGLRNQPGHKELQENNTGPNKGSIRNCEENSIESRIARKHNQLQVVAHGFRFFKSA